MDHRALAFESMKLLTFVLPTDFSNGLDFYLRMWANNYELIKSRRIFMSDINSILGMRTVLVLPCAISMVD